MEVLRWLKKSNYASLKLNYEMRIIEIFRFVALHSEEHIDIVIQRMKCLRVSN